MELAKNYKGGLLLVHGWMDDNVHPAHTLRVVDALIKAGKNFDLIMLPRSNHGFSGEENIFYGFILPVSCWGIIPGITIMKLNNIRNLIDRIC